MKKNLGTLILLFLANSISKFSTGITILAIPWYLVSNMGSENGKFLNSALMGTVTFLALFWGTYAGTLVDKYNRKRIFQVMTFTDGILLSIAALIGFQLGSLPFPVIAAVALVTIFTYNLHFPNLYAFVQELFEPEYYRKVNSAIELQNQITTFFGMVIGGLLIAGSSSLSWWPDAWTVAPWKLEEIFLLDGATYFAACLILSFIRYRPDPNRKVDPGSVFERVRDGMQYVIQRKSLLIFGIGSYVVFFTLLVFIQVIMPVYIHDYLNFSELKGGAVLMETELFYAGGAITAGILGTGLAGFIKKTNLVGQIIGMLFGAAIVYFMWSFTRSQWILYAGAYLIGIMNAGVRILRITYLIRIVPNHKIGRANAFFQITNVLMRVSLIALLTLPFFSAEENGGNIVYALMLMGGATLLSGIILLVKFSNFDKEAAYG